VYDMLVNFFPCRVYIDSSHHDTLGYGGNLSLQSSRSMCWCTVDGFEELNMHMVMIILPL
jgi:hypothetical protein